MKLLCLLSLSLSLLSRPARGAWVEIPTKESSVARIESRPARGAWVEMPLDSRSLLNAEVAPRKGRVG